MPRKLVKIDWPALDWTKSNAQLARESGVSGEYVRQHRQALFPPKTLRKPRGVVLEATAKATAKKYAVPWTVANQWHLEAGKTAKPGRPRYSLSEDSLPPPL